MKTSVVIVTYRRLENLERILRAWLAQADEVFLADCSNKFETMLPITHIRFKPDLGNKVRHAVALLTNGKFVIKADDDLLPKPGLVDDFLRAERELGSGILGIIGRKFHGKSYYEDVKFYRADKLDRPKNVNFVGVCTFSPRNFLAFDLRGCFSSVEDLYWQMKMYPHVQKWVIPTKNYANLPECNDKESLFHNKEAKEIREAFYREYWGRFQQ